MYLYIHIYMHIYKHIYIYMYKGVSVACFWWRTDGVNTNGAAAKETHFDRLWKKALLGTLGKIKAGSREYPKGHSVKQS